MSPSKPTPPSDPFEVAHIDLPVSSPFHGRITILPSCTSTQDLLRAQLPPPPAVLAAGIQTAGHGRQGKTWISEKPLGLWVSLLLEVPPDRLPVLSLLGSLAVADTIHSLAGVSPSLKWPNDLLLQNRKLAGLLVETVSRKNLPPLALLGLGLNLHQQTRDFPSKLQSSAISVFQATGQTFPRARMLEAFLNNLLLRINRPVSETLDDWRKACPQLGRLATVRTGTETIQGVAEKLDDSGHLHLRLPDGAHRILASGETDFPA